MAIRDRYNVTDPPLPSNIECRIEQRMLPMRDGVKLHTAIYFPLDEKPRKKYHAVLVRSPYMQKPQFYLPDEKVLKQGFVYVFQSCRGTGWSEGLFDPAERRIEEFDAEDTLNYLQRQSWFSGRCAMAGGSYPGWVQWCAARTGHPALVAVTPRVAPLYSCCGAATAGGGAKLSFSLHWPLSMYHRRTYGYAGVPDFQKMGVSLHLPVLEADRFCGYPELPQVRKFLKAAQNPGKLLSAHVEEFSRIRVPAYISGSWFDGFLTQSVESFLLMRQKAATEEAREFTRLVIGPWGHGDLMNPDLFGSRNKVSFSTRRAYRFFSSALRNPMLDPLPSEPRVRYFMLWENRWRSADQWPPARVKAKKLYLHSQGSANTAAGDGVLTSRAPNGMEEPDVFVSDPLHPACSNGGKHEALGCYDRSSEESRSDVLVYSTPVWEKDCFVTGAVELHFHASISTEDADFVAILTSVMPDGRSMFLGNGMIRVRYRNDLDRAVPAVPGKIEEYTITLSPTAAKFAAGWKLRVELCAQYFPALAPNLNTMEPFGEGRETRTSVQKIFHDAEHPSYITVPFLEE